MTAPTTISEFKTQFATKAKESLLSVDLSTATTEQLITQGAIFNQSVKVDVDYPLYTHNDFSTDLSDIYSTGGATFIKSGNWVDISSLDTATKANFASALTVNTNLAVTDSVATGYYSNNCMLDGISPPAIVGTTRCIGLSSAANSSGCYSATINASGVQVINSGQVAGYTSTAGAKSVITSDGTKFWQWTAASATAFGAYSSTDGITWTAETLTGLPTFADLTSLPFFGKISTVVAPIGDANQSSNALFSLYCGTRHLLIGTGASYLIAATSTNGLAWTDVTASMLGSTTVANAASAINFVYKNGNTVAILLDGGIGRYTTDGGATWSACTGVPNFVIDQHAVKADATTPANLVISHNGSTNLYVSNDSGATWTNRTNPLGSNVAVTSIKGGTIVVSKNGVIKKSTDNGATWSSVTIPQSIASSIITSVYCDAYRWYMVSNSQIATSTDLSTWTLRTINNLNIALGLMNGVCSIDVNTIVIYDSTKIAVSLDGGVTWNVMSILNVAVSGQHRLLPNTTGTNLIFNANSLGSNGNHTIATKSELANGFKLAKVTLIAASSAGLAAFLRIE
jgi:hypothetical protein